MGERGSGSRRGGRIARLRVGLARAIVDGAPGGAPALRTALREYVRAAREAGLGARDVLAEVDRAWRRRGAAATGLLTRDVLEVATLLELGAGEERAPRAAPLD